MRLIDDLLDALPNGRICDVRIGLHWTAVVAKVDGTDPTCWRQQGASRHRCWRQSLVMTTLVRFAYNVPRIIACINNPKNAWGFTPEMGVDIALNGDMRLLEAEVESPSQSDWRIAGVR